MLTPLLRASNPEYKTPAGRRQHYEVFKPELERALAKRTAAEWCERLQAKGVPCGAVADLQGLAIFLAASASDYVTGQTIYCDGGFTAK